MTNEIASNHGVAEATARVSGFRRFWRVFLTRGVVKFGAVVLFLLIVIALFAPFIAPCDPNVIDLTNTLSQPSAQHWLGTDTLGRDILSRLIYGSRISLQCGAYVVLVSASIGVTLGTIAGYYGGWPYNIIMRIVDAKMAFPGIVLTLLLASVLGRGIGNVIIALSISFVPAYARMMCGMVLSAKENDYIQACRAMGASNVRIMLRHVFPNCFAPLIIMMSMALGGATLAEAGLSYLGIGIPPPTPTWGGMVNDGQLYLLYFPILSLAPGVAVTLLVFSFNMVGDGLRDALDPRLRGTV